MMKLMAPAAAAATLVPSGPIARTVDMHFIRALMVLSGLLG